MKRARVALALAVVVVAAVPLARTVSFPSRQPQVAPVAVEPLDTAALARRLAGALRFKTISFQDSSQFDAREFEGLHRYLRDSFPKLHAALKLEKVNGYGLLYEWTGSDPGLAPVVLLAHQDVVPVEPGTEGRWTEPPFAGRIAGGYVWGGGGHPRRRTRPARNTADAAGHSRPHGGHVRLPRSRDAVRASSGDGEPLAAGRDPHVAVRYDAPGQCAAPHHHRPDRAPGGREGERAAVHRPGAGQLPDPAGGQRRQRARARAAGGRRSPDRRECAADDLQQSVGGHAGRSRAVPAAGAYDPPGGPWHRGDAVARGGGHRLAPLCPAHAQCAALRRSHDREGRSAPGPRHRRTGGRAGLRRRGADLHPAAEERSARGSSAVVSQ